MEEQAQCIRENRAEIDAAILPVLNNETPVHHLAYRPGSKYIGFRYAPIPR